MSEVDSDLAAALAEDEEDDDQPQAAAPPVPQPAPASPVKKNKGGRPRKNSGPISQPATSASSPEPADVGPRELDVGAIWEDIIERIGARGLGGAEQVSIAARQTIIGPNREEAKQMAPIDGASVAGTSSRTPGEDLIDYLERVFQVATNAGPAKYRLWFQLRGGAKNDRSLGTAEVVLQSAADIRKRWEAVATMQRDRERERDFGGAAPSYRRPTYAGAPERHAPQAFDGGSMPTPAAPAAAGGNAFMESMFDRVWGMYERERREAARLGQAPPPPPDPRTFMQQPAAPAVDNLEERIARTVTQTLQTLGVIPTPGAPPLAPAAPPLTTPVVAQAVTAPMTAAKEFFTQMREFRRMEAEMREMFAPEEEEETPVAAPALPTVVVAPEVDEHAMQPVNEQFIRFEGEPVMYGKQAEGETTLQWLTRNALGNPKISGKILEKGMQMLDQGTFGKLVSALTNMGGQQAQAVRNLPPNAAQPQANGSQSRAAGWTPNIG